MSMFRRKQYDVPGLNTASLPDLIFTVLFFFMIVTHMRKVALKVKYKVPQGTELTRLVKKSAVSYIYIGKPSTSGGATKSNVTRIQMNDKYVSTDDIVDYITQERNSMSPEDRQQMVVSIKADVNTKMETVAKVKQALRIAKVTKINYSSTEKGNGKQLAR